MHHPLKRALLALALSSCALPALAQMPQTYTDVNGFPHSVVPTYSLNASSSSGGGAVYGNDAAGAAPSKPPVYTGGIDPSGNVQALHLDANKYLQIDLSGGYGSSPGAPSYVAPGTGTAWLLGGGFASAYCAVSTSAPSYTSGTSNSESCDPAGDQRTIDANSAANLTAVQATANAQGAGGTSITQPTGGSGVLGWLSGIYKALTGTLTVSGSVSCSSGCYQATQPVSGTVSAAESGTWNVGLSAGSSLIGYTGTTLNPDVVSGTVSANVDSVVDGASGSLTASSTGAQPAISSVGFEGLSLIATGTISYQVQWSNDGVNYAPATEFGQIGMNGIQSPGNPQAFVGGGSSYIGDIHGSYMRFVVNSYTAGATITYSLKRQPQVIQAGGNPYAATFTTPTLTGGAANAGQTNISGASNTGAGTGSVALAPHSSSNGAPLSTSATSAQLSAGTFVAKSSAGNFYGWNVCAGSTAGYAVIENQTTTLSGALSVPLRTQYLAVNQCFDLSWDIPKRAATGITFGFTSSLTTFTAVAPAAVTVDYE